LGLFRIKVKGYYKYGNLGDPLVLKFPLTVSQKKIKLRSPIRQRRKRPPGAKGVAIFALIIFSLYDKAHQQNHITPLHLEWMAFLKAVVPDRQGIVY
jgi:hypothetical protein